MKNIINIASFYWVCVIYCLHNQYFILGIYADWWLSVLLYFATGIVVGWSSLLYLIKFSNKKIENNLEIQKIFPIYREFMPIYLAIVVIAFGIKDFTQIQNSFVVLIIFVFIYLLFHISNIGYLNPIWYILGYRVYKIENSKAVYMLITKGQYKSIDKIDNIIKIDEFTFIKGKE